MTTKKKCTHEDCPFLGYACGDYFCMFEDEKENALPENKRVMSGNSKTVCAGCLWLSHILDLVCDKDVEKKEALADQARQIFEEIEENLAIHETSDEYIYPSEWFHKSVWQNLKSKYLGKEAK